MFLSCLAFMFAHFTTGSNLILNAQHCNTNMGTKNHFPQMKNKKNNPGGKKTFIIIQTLFNARTALFIAY